MLAFHRKGPGLCVRALAVLAAISAPILIPQQVDAGAGHDHDRPAAVRHEGRHPPPETATQPSETPSPAATVTPTETAATAAADPSPTPAKSTPAEAATGSNDATNEPPATATGTPSPEPTGPPAVNEDDAPASNASESADAPTATPTPSGTPSSTATADDSTADDGDTPPDADEHDDESLASHDDEDPLAPHSVRHPHEHPAPPRLYPEWSREPLWRKFATIQQLIWMVGRNAALAGGTQSNTQAAANVAGVQQVCTLRLCSNQAVIGQQTVLQAANVAGRTAAQVNVASGAGASQSNTQVSTNDAYVSQVCIDWCVNYVFIYQGDYLTGANLAAANAAAELAQANTQVSVNAAGVQQFCNTNCSNIAIILQASVQLALNAAAAVAEDVAQVAQPAAGSASQSNTQISVNDVDVVQGCAGVCWNSVIVWQGTIQEALNAILPPGQV
mgnify:CR=1 FL=1